MKILNYKQITLIICLTFGSVFTYGQDYHFQYGWSDELPEGWTEEGFIFFSGNTNDEWSGHYGSLKAAKVDPGEYMQSIEYSNAGTLSFWLRAKDEGLPGDVYVELGVVNSSGDISFTEIWSIESGDAYPKDSPDGGSNYYRQHEVEINNNTDNIVLRFGVRNSGLGLERKAYFDDVALTSTETLSVLSPTAELDVQFSPNPARDYIDVKIPEALNGKINLYNITGQKVKSTLIDNKSDIKINISDLSQGLYILSVEAGLRNYRGKLIVE